MATLTVLSREIRSRRAPARSAPALLVGLLAASLAKVSDLADRASYPVSPPAARTKRCIAARKTSWSSTPGGASPACTAPPGVLDQEVLRVLPVAHLRRVLRQRNPRIPALL